MIGRRSKQYEMDMCSGSLAGKILLFSLPLMLSSLLQLLFNAADVIVVGRYAAMPTQAVAAVGSNGALINLTINLFMGISVGANVVVAQDLGAGRGERVGRSIETAITLALVSGFALSVFGVICVRQLLEWMSCPADVIDLSTQYMRIYFVGMPGNLVYNFGAALLRAKGDTQRPLSYLTAAGVINVILNLILVIGLHLDVAGVAIATVVSQYVSAALVVWCLTKESGPFHLDLRQLKMEKAALMRMMRIGVPAGFQGTLFSISNVIIQSALNSFGNSALIAGTSASASIEMFVYSSDNAISQAAPDLRQPELRRGQVPAGRPRRRAVHRLYGGVPAGLRQSGLLLRRAFGRTVCARPGGGHLLRRGPHGLPAAAAIPERHHGHRRQRAPRAGLFLLPHGGHPDRGVRVPRLLGLYGVPCGPHAGVPVYLLPHLLDGHHRGAAGHLPGTAEKALCQDAASHLCAHGGVRPV